LQATSLKRLLASDFSQATSRKQLLASNFSQATSRKQLLASDFSQATSRTLKIDFKNVPKVLNGIVGGYKYSDILSDFLMYSTVCQEFKKLFNSNVSNGSFHIFHNHFTATSCILIKGPLMTIATLVSDGNTSFDTIIVDLSG
jgi:hypothetical protein